MNIVSWLRAMGWLALAGLLASCGGGGDGGGSSGPFSVGLSRNSVSWSYLEGVPAHSPAIAVNTQGTPTSDVFVGLITANGQPDHNIDQVADVYDASGNSIGFALVPAAGLRAGTYTGALQFVACRDDMCRSHYPGSPANLSYSFTVSPNVRVTPGALRLTGIAGAPASGEIGVELPAGVTSYTAVPDDAAVVVSNLTNNGFRVTAPARDAGTYSTTIRVRSGMLGMDVPLTQVATPRILTLDQTHVTLSATSASSASVRINVLQLGEGAGALRAIANQPQWLAVSDVSDSGFTITARPLPAGTYTGGVEVRSGTNGLVTVGVTYTVTSAGGPQHVDLQPRQLTLTAGEGGRSSTQLLTLTMPTWNPDVTIVRDYSSGQNWLRTTLRPDGVVEVWADATGLPRGTYHGAVGAVVAYPAAYIPASVTLTVGDGLATPAAQSVVIHAGTTNAALRGSVTVASQGATALTWTASIPPSTDWMRLTRTSGSLGDNVEFEVDMPAALLHPAYTDITVPVTINARSGSTALTPVTGRVTLRREPAEVSAVGPFSVAANKAATVQVRGRGFDRLADPAAHLVIDGITATSVTRTSPTTLSVQLPATNAVGRHTVSMTNILNGPTSSAALTVLPPSTRTATTSITVGTPVSGLVQHPVTGSIYLISQSWGRVYRLREAGGQWLTDTLTMPYLSDIGLSLDGTHLVVTDTRGTLVLIDNESFTEAARYVPSAPTVTQPHPGPAVLSITLDGKVWLPGRGRPAYFDLNTRQYGYGPALAALIYDVDVHQATPRDGSRSVFTDYRNPLGATRIHMDTADGEWRVVSGLEFAGAMSFDDTGSRMIANGAVFNREFQMLGRLVLPESGRVQAATSLSPDGRRAYVLARSTATPAPPTPRVYVFSTEVNPGDVVDLPLLGSFDLDDHLQCTPSNPLGSSCYSTHLQVSPDGLSLVMASSQQLKLVPLPASYTTQGARSQIAPMKRWQPAR